MKPARFRYVRPSTVEGAVASLVGDEDAKVLAGGQSLIPMMNLRLAKPATLVDIGRIEELRRLERSGSVLSIGAAVPQAVVERSPLVRQTLPILPAALRFVAHPQVRARGTLVGSLAHADPGSELCAVALALGAELVIAGPRGSRTCNASEFFLGPYFTSLGLDEVLVEVRLPIVPGLRTGFAEIARRSGDFAIAGAAVAAQADAGGSLTHLRVAALGVGPRPIELSVPERELVGTVPSAASVVAAAEATAAEADLSAGGDIDLGTRRAALQKVLTEALQQACDLTDSDTAKAESR